MKRIGTAALLSAGGAAAYGVTLISLDVLIAHRYGLGGQAAVFQVAYQIPSTLISILSGGAILGPLIPLVSRSLRQGRAATSDLLVRVAGFILASQALAVLLVYWFTPQVVRAVASGFSTELQSEVAAVLRWLLPLLLLNGLASIGIATLLASRRVVLANLAPALMPLAGMATWWFWDAHGASWIAWGYLAGTVLQIVLLAGYLRHDDLTFFPPAWPRGEAMRTFMRAFVATALAHAALATVLLVNTAIAGSLSERDLAAFVYGGKLVLLALAFLTSLVNNVGLPYLSELVQQGDREALRRRLGHILRLTAAAGTALAFFWVIGAGWIVDLLYARGKFSTGDAAAVVAVQRIFVLQAPFYLVGVVCWRTLNIFGEWRPLVLASLAALLIDVLAASILAPRHAAAGVAGAHALSMVAWAAVLLLAVRKRCARETEGLHS